VVVRASLYKESNSIHYIEMSNPNLDRFFSYESVNEYFLAKISKFDFHELTLPTTVFRTLEAFVSHIADVRKKYNIVFPVCSHSETFTWEAYINQQTRDSAIRMWVYRDYIFSLCMIHMGKVLGDQRLWSVHRTIPETLDITKNNFTVIGSQKLTSDIDVTIQGPHSAVVISVIEDIFQALTYDSGIPLRCMDVEFYGDFRILNNLFVNVSRFSTVQRQQMLQYAYISYFRSLHITGTDYSVSPLARRIGEIYLKRMGSQATLDAILDAAHAEWISTAPDGVLNRERFYAENTHAEIAANLLIKQYGTKNAVERVANNVTNSAANDIFFSIARGNIHRAESYILPSTAVHVVEIEQVLGNKVADDEVIPKSWFTENAQIGVDEFAYLASAIEQAGYLEHYHPDTTTCNKKGVKYFGRMVRGMIHAKLLDNSFMPIYNALNEYRRSEDSTVCPYNIHELLTKIVGSLGKRGGRRTLRRSTRRRKSLGTRRR